MKQYLLLAALFFNYSLMAQRIKVNEIDKFTKERRIETSFSWLKRGIGCGIGFYFRSVDDTRFMTASGYNCGADVIGARDEIIFLLDNDSTISLTPTSIQGYNVGSSGNTYTHQYNVTLEQIKLLSKHKIKSIRKYGHDSYEDISIPKGNQSDIMDNATVYLSALNK